MLLESVTPFELNLIVHFYQGAFSALNNPKAVKTTD
jgi:hypothetical protein